MPKGAGKDIKGGRVKIPHPNSRKAAQMTKKFLRLQKINRQRQERSRFVRKKVERLLWFREHMETDRTCYSHAEMLQLIDSYLHRHDEELDRIVERRVGKGPLAGHYWQQYASREDTIRSIIARDQELFKTCGIEAPDLTDSNVFKTFIEWQGERNFLPKIKLKKFRTMQV